MRRRTRGGGIRYDFFMPHCPCEHCRAGWRNPFYHLAWLAIWFRGEELKTSITFREYFQGAVLGIKRPSRRERRLVSTPIGEMWT